MIRYSIRLFCIALMLVALPSLAGNADFDRMLALEGEWVEQDEDGKREEQIASIWQVTAGGTAIIETMHPGTDHEMITMYHRSGDKLALTHYCAIGNQPRMEAVADGGTIEFKCAGGDNIPDENTPHMHAMVLEIVDKNHVIATWSHYDGTDEDHKMTLDLVRK